MTSTNPTLEALASAIDVSALRQSVYTANIANASVDGYRRMEVSFDRELARVATQMADMHASMTPDAQLTAGNAHVVPTDAAVKLDEEMGLMARNALRYQTLIGAFEKTMGLLRTAIREGRE